MGEPSTSDDPLNIALPTEPPIPRHTTWFLLAYYALGAMWGMRNAWYWERSLLDLLIPVALAIALGRWAITDARRRRKPIPFSAIPWLYLLAGIVVPMYFLFTRGWKGIGWVVLHAVCWYILATIAMHAAGTLIFGADWWVAMGA